MALPATYRAYQYDHYGNIKEQLQLRPAVPLPLLGADQVRIKVSDAAINPIDSALVEYVGKVFTGKEPTSEHPYGIGFDVAGTVVELGANVSKFNIGDQVYAMTPWSGFGTIADYIGVDQTAVALKPTNLSFEQAAAVPLVALTSYQALVDHTKLQKDERVLILGGSSATGHFAIQLARALGAKVVATTSFRNAEFVKAAGADQVIDYTKEKWADVLETHSIDVIYDCGMENDAWNTGAQQILKKNTGRFVTLLPLAEPVREAEFGAQLAGNMLVQPSGEQLSRIAEYIEKGQVVIPIDSVFPFEQLQEAIDKLKTRRARGKIVIKVA